MNDSPQAPRLATPSWLDTRLVLGVLLVLVSVVLGARLLASADESQSVWATTRDLAPGTTLTAGDLERTRVRLLDRGSGYVPATDAEPPSGYVLSRGVGAGELLPRAALRQPDRAPELRDVSVPVEPGHLPSDLDAGQLVDVYVTPEGDGTGAAPEAGDGTGGAGGTGGTGGTAPEAVAGTGLVLSDVAVKRRGGDDRGTDAEAVVLSVTAADAERLVVAVRSGLIDLVRVPDGADLGRLPAVGAPLAEPAPAP